MALLLLLASSALAQESPPVQISPRIVNGLPTQEFAPVGALLYGEQAPATLDNAVMWCTGTLIGCNTFLTAAHCIQRDFVPEHYRVYFQHRGLVDVTAIQAHPDFTSPAFPAYDVAVLTLAEPVTGVRPAPINRTIDPTDAGLGQRGTIVGFGRTGGSRQDFGLKRVGMVRTADCAGAPVDELGSDELVCWRFESPLGPAGTDSNTCNGDSGGPLFLELGDGPVVAGVTSGGSTTTCLASDIAFDANVYYYRDFIDDALALDPANVCPAGPKVGDAAVTVRKAAGTLDADTPFAVYALDVPNGLAELRITLNALDDLVFDGRLYVAQGTDPENAVLTPTCAHDGVSNFGGCRLVDPAPGPWRIVVESVGGRPGDFQLTGTAIQGVIPPFVEIQPPNPLPGVCLEERFDHFRGKARRGKVRLRARIRPASPAWRVLDPRAGFALTLAQDGQQDLTLAIPPGDAGWSRSRPDRGVYRWSGDRAGLRKVRATLRTRRDGSTQWKLKVAGKRVGDAVGFDLKRPAEVELRMGGLCNRARLP